MVSFFSSRGYQSFGLYPSLSWDWPEKSFYAFDVFVDGRDLKYAGPHFGSWWIPDQFSIARFEQMYPVQADTAPRFVVFPTIMSHLPFAPVPPYQPDWKQLLTDRPFEADQVDESLRSQPNWLNMKPDYLRSIVYTFDWLTGYVSKPPARDRVLILIGDHQPASSVSGPGASWDVPVHVISSNPQLIQRLLTAGMQPGLEPTRPGLGAMHEFTQILLDAFDGRRCLGRLESCSRKP